MKKKVYDFGFRCTRCNRKISDKALMGDNGSRIEKSGNCMTCNNKLDSRGAESIMLLKIEGSGTYKLNLLGSERYAVPTLEKLGE